MEDKITSWAEFARQAPELAVFGKARLQSGVAYLGTLRADGSPRVHPVTPIIGEQLFLFMEPTSPKGKDLRRDARYTLHCAIEDASGGNGEFYVRGRAAFTGDPRLREEAVRASSYVPAENYIVFVFGVEFAFMNTYVNGQPNTQRWQAPDSITHGRPTIANGLQASPFGMHHADKFKALGDLIQSSMSHLHIPGVALGVLLGDEVYTAGFGVNNVEHPLPVDSGTLFQVGSITKTMTSTLLLRLREAGLVDLDVPLRTYLPDLRLADEAVAAGVTLRHALTHTGGWAGDFFDDCGPGDEALARMVGRLAELPQLTPLGSLWAYNNTGFYLAGRVVEVVTGQSYEAAAREWLLAPLGLARAFFFAADAITHRVAAGHDAVFDDKPVTVARPWALARTGHAVGGLVCGVDDLLRYAGFHLGDGTAGSGERLLSPATLAEMHTPQVPAANGEQMALTWFVRDVGGLRCLRHGGATNGQAATLWLAPERRFALAVLTNSDRGDELHQSAAAWALEHLLGVKEPPAPSFSLSNEALAEYAGRYRAQAADLEISPADGGLRLQVIPKGGFPTASSPPSPAPPPVRLAFRAPDQVVALDEPMRGNRGEFLRGPEGGLRWLRLGGRLYAPCWRL